MKTNVFENVFNNIAAGLTNRSVMLSGIGDCGSIPIIDNIEELGDFDFLSFSLGGFSEKKSLLEYFQQFLEKLLERAKEHALINSTLYEENPQDNEASIEVIIDRIILLLSQLEACTQDNKLLIIIIDCFYITYCQKEYEIILDHVNHIISYHRKIRFLFLVDRSLIAYGRINDQNISIMKNLEFVESGVKAASSESIKLIKNNLSLEITNDIYDLMVDLTGRMPILIGLLCDEINRVCREDAIISLTSEIVSDIANNFVLNSRFDLVQSWWENLSSSEQLIILMMSFLSGKDEIKAFHTQTLQNEIRQRTGATIDLDPIMSNLELKGFLVDSQYGYKLTSGLHKLWISNKFGQSDFLRKLIGAKLLKLVKTPTEYDKYIIDKYIQPLSNQYLLKDQSFSNPVILHISDIQFGLSHAFDDVPSEKHYSLLNSLLLDMGRNFKDEHIPYPNLIVVSGDIADWGMPKEYNRASEFLNGLISGMKKLPGYEHPLSQEEVVIVPGNHDINWPISEKGLSERGDSLEPNELYDYRFIAYREFFNSFYLGKKFYPLDPQKAFTIYNYSKRNGLVVVGFNSCHSEDHKDHKGIISIDTIDNAEAAIEEMINRREIPPNLLKCKVAVWHHDYRIGGGFTDYLQNANDVIKELRHRGYSIGLFGHIHRLAHMSIAPDSQTPIKLFGAGSIGVRTDQRPGTPKHGNFPLSYNVISFSLDTTPYKIRTYVRQGDPIEQGVKWIPWAGWEGSNPLSYEADLYQSTK